jgi:imidazolonepropionase-like amidohydrolase
MDREGVLRDHTVVVKNGRIAEVGPAAKVKAPPGATKVDGRGEYLMPGFGEMHGHIPPPTDPAQYVNDVLFLYVANGVTTVRGMLGHPGQLDLREKAKKPEADSPALYLAGPSFSGTSIQSVEQAVARVRQQKSEGWDLLKIHPGVTLAQYDAVAKTAGEVKIPFAGHVPAEVGVLHALEVKQQTIDHLDGYMEYLGNGAGTVPQEKLVEMARRTKAAGVWVVPTMVVWETILGSNDKATIFAFPELQYLPRPLVAQWKKTYEGRLAAPQFNLAQVKRIAEDRKRLLKAMDGEGVRILFGTDAPQQFSVPGFSIHRELQAMAAAGMKPYDILRSGTSNVGEYLKEKDKFGTLTAGSRADAILLEANPLEDVGNVGRRAGVLVRGRWMPESEIQSKLAAIVRRNASQ